MTEWRGRARSILGQGVERLKDGALQWVTRLSRDAAESVRSPGAPEPERRSRLQRALGLLRFGMGMGRNGARRVRGRVSRTIRWATARVPGGILSVVAAAQRPASDGSPQGPGIRATAAPHATPEGSVRSGFFSGSDASRRPGRGDPSQLRAFGRDSRTLFAMWEVRSDLRPKHLTAPLLQLRVRALGGAEVLRRQVELHGSLYLDGLVPGATYVVELWWTSGADESPLAMPPASVTLAMGPPSPGEAASPVSFGTWSGDAMSPQASPLRGPAAQPTSPPAWMPRGMGHPWAGSQELSATGATSAGGTRSGSGSGFGHRATSPGAATSPGRGLGSGSGSGWGRATTSPGASWHQGMGDADHPGHAPAAPRGGWADGAGVGPGEKRSPAAWTLAEVEALIRPVRGPQPAPPQPVPAPPRTEPVSQVRSVPSEAEHARATGRPGVAKTERPIPRSQRGRKGRARRRRAQQEARAQQDGSGAQTPPGETLRTEEPSVRRGFFQEAPSGPAGRRGRR